MKRLLCFVLCMCLFCTLIPSAFAITTKEQILSDIDPMLDEQNYDGIINYFTLVKNESQTIAGATKPFVRDNTLILPTNLTEIGDSAFADDTAFDSVIIPDSVIKISDSAFSGISNLTIIANEGSYAYTWASNHGYTVSSLPVYPDEFTITLTADNFYDYFEFVTLPRYNVFGEIQDGQWRIGVRSKLYDLGYIVKGDLDHNIYVEIQYHRADRVETRQDQLATLLSFINGISGNSITNFSLTRIISGEITFIDNSLVSSYTLESRESGFGPDTYRAKIVLENGKLFDRTVVDGYLY